MERKVFLFIVLAFGLFVGKAQTVSKERLIEIADSVYNLPRFADYQIKNGEPVIIEKETADLPLEQLLQRPSSSPFYGCTKPKCKYYIVRYPCDTEVYNTLENKDKEIERLNGLNQKLVSANGSLLQQVSAGFERNPHGEEDETPKKSFNFRDAFDEKGHFKKKM